jgi:recA bacterial DNA recombination protein
MPEASAEETLTTALARLESRWGSAAVRLASDMRTVAPKVTAETGIGVGLGAGQLVDGALALAIRAQPAPELEPTDASLPDEIVPTGFKGLDALLGTGGLPRGVSASFRGARSSGKTALALHCLAQAQARGGIVAFLDLCRIFDPLEAVGRGVDLRWLLVLRPADVDEGWALAAALVAGHQIDLLVVDLPSRLRASHEVSVRRLAAHARRSSVRMIVLEPTGICAPVHGALAESVGLRLELEQRAWLRAGRDIVGRCVSVSVAKNRFGPPGRQTEIEIRYLAETEIEPALERYAVRDVAEPLDPVQLPSTSHLATLMQPDLRRLPGNRPDLPPFSQLAVG